MKTFTLKATRDDSSRSIIVAFRSLWYDPIQRGAFSVFFRKKAPLKFQPDLVYAYLTTPVSAIVAQLSISRCESQDVKQAAGLAKKSLLTQEEILAYAKQYTRLFVFTVDAIHLAKNPLTLQRLEAEYDFWPSSNFTPLSENGKTTIDRLCRFK